MAGEGFNTSPFVLPSSFGTPGAALENALDRKERRDERQYQIDYRAAKDKEAEDWRKLNLIQDLTNLDKYQTGEAAADAVGFQKAHDIFQKYTAQAGNMSPAELQYKISQDIGKTTLGMQSMKDELMKSDAAIKQLKQIYPSLDVAGLTKEHRKEIMDRRIQGSDFTNPVTVEPSKFKLDDPDFVSAFVKGSEALTKAIRNPSYVEKGVTVATGSPSSYTQMKGDLPYYRKLNFDPTKDIKEGFYKGKNQPGMDIKSSTVMFKGKPAEVLDEEAFKVLTSDPEAEIGLRTEARKKYPDYDLMNNSEKELARREVAVDKIKTLDQSGFSFAGATKPPHYSSTTNVYGGTGGENINDIYNEIKAESDQHTGGKTPLINLSTEAQKAIIEQARAINDKDITQEDIWVEHNKDGTLDIMKITEPDRSGGVKIGVLTPKGVNITKQPGVKEKREVIQRSKIEQSKQKTYKGLDKNGNPIFE